MSVTLKFSGHESFHCRPFWLKKGYDFVKSGQHFTDKAGIELGVGRNMVGAIRFWLNAFDLIDETKGTSELADKLFGDKGWDPFLEDEGTLWLLHYKLISKNYSSIYHVIFSEIRKKRPEFAKHHLITHVKEIDKNQSENILGKDFGVFAKSYLADQDSEKEDSFSGLFTELGLLQKVGKDSQKNDLYNISNTNHSSVPWQVVFYCILDNEKHSDSVSVKSMFADDKGVGTVFAFSKDSLEQKLVEIGQNLKDVVYSSEAGVKELQFKKGKPDGIKILKDYYNGK